MRNRNRKPATEAKEKTYNNPDPTARTLDPSVKKLSPTHLDKKKSIIKEIEEENRRKSKNKKQEIYRLE
jgi:hypothetical protein